jgi:hypothetical protein
MKKLILFPCYPLNSKKVDPDFESEYNVCKQLGLDTILFDFDLFIRDNITDTVGAFKLQKKHKKLQATCVYRGWMLKLRHYKILYQILNSNGIELINTPSQYKMAHYFPEAYPYIEDHTPYTKWIDKDTFETGTKDFIKSLIKGKVTDFRDSFIF